MIILLDEDIPRAFGNIFRGLDYEVLDVRDEDLKSASDEAVFIFACDRNALIFTADLGFVNPGRFDLKKIPGLILNRLPETIPLSQRSMELQILLSSIDKDSLLGYITVFSLKRIRRRAL